MTNDEVKAHNSLALNAAKLRIGLPMWYMPQWRGELLPPGCDQGAALFFYAQQFSTIEGNTTFYGLPSQTRAEQWTQAVPDDFRFVFKLPRTISHSHNLNAAIEQYGGEWQTFCGILGQKLGVALLQLPAEFGPRRLPELMAALDQLQQITAASIAVEVRHPELFAKGEAEQALLQGLSQRCVDRVCFDSRGLFHDHSESAAVKDAQFKKPRLPLHPVATGKHPIVRFIGHSDWRQDDQFLLQWHNKLAQWQAEGRRPYFFIHTAGNDDVPQRANAICQLWRLPQLQWQARQPSLL